MYITKSERTCTCHTNNTNPLYLILNFKWCVHALVVAWICYEAFVYSAMCGADFVLLWSRPCTNCFLLLVLVLSWAIEQDTGYDFIHYGVPLAAFLLMLSCTWHPFLNCLFNRALYRTSCDTSYVYIRQKRGFLGLGRKHAWKKSRRGEEATLDASAAGPAFIILFFFPTKAGPMAKASSLVSSPCLIFFKRVCIYMYII